MFTRVWIVGIVGSVRRRVVQNKVKTTFSVVVQYNPVKDDEGNVIDVLWFDCEGFIDEVRLRKGAHVDVKGRLRLKKYVNAGGEHVSVPSIVVREVTVLKDENTK